MNASRRLNSPAPSESLKKKGVRGREKKGPKLAIMELVLFCGRKSFQGALLEEAGPDKKTMTGSDRTLRGTQPGTVNADYCGSEPPKKRGTLVRRKMRNYFFPFPSETPVHCAVTMRDGGHLTCPSSRPCWRPMWGPRGTRAAQTQTKPILTQ